MVALSQYCSVMEIREWGKLISGRNAAYLDGGNVDVTDDQQIIAHW